MNRTGFGFLRLPRTGAGGVDLEKTCRLADRFIDLGGTYFDTAYTYLDGESERALREAVIRRHPRNRVRIADKLPTWLVRNREDRGRIFAEQLARCGVEYFDTYLLHGLDRENYAACAAWDGFGFLEELKRRGRTRTIGFSYHGGAELLNRILTEHPEVDCVQLQINYLDWESPTIQARRCYEVAAAHKKRILVMEPVKGGSLAALPPEAEARLRALVPGESMAAWALRFAASLDGVELVLSGMNEIGQIEDNLRRLSPLTPRERSALADVAERIHAVTAVGCTGCGYCLSGCPRGIPIPDCFKLYNEYRRSPGELWKMGDVYAGLPARAGDCAGCGACAHICPQKLDVPALLREVAQAFESAL